MASTECKTHWSHSVQRAYCCIMILVIQFLTNFESLCSSLRWCFVWCIHCVFVSFSFCAARTNTADACLSKRRTWRCRQNHFALLEFSWPKPSGQGTQSFSLSMRLHDVFLPWRHFADKLLFLSSSNFDFEATFYKFRRSFWYVVGNVRRLKGA